MAESPRAGRVREIVARRARHSCEYCRSQERYSPDPFSIEHIVPRSRGGDDEDANLAFSCQGCNNLKYTSVEAADPETNQLVPLFHPRRDRWNDHFAWSDDLTRIIGITPTGRATVAKLQLNREGIVNLRAVLAAAGRHPPHES